MALERILTQLFDFESSLNFLGTGVAGIELSSDGSVSDQAMADAGRLFKVRSELSKCEVDESSRLGCAFPKVWYHCGVQPHEPVFSEVLVQSFFYSKCCDFCCSSN